MSRADRSVPTDKHFILYGAARTQLRRRFPSSVFPNCVAANGLILKSHRFLELISMRRPTLRLTANGCSFLQGDQRNRTRMAAIGTFGLSIGLTVSGANRRNSANRLTPR